MVVGSDAAAGLWRGGSGAADRVLHDGVSAFRVTFRPGNSTLGDWFEAWHSSFWPMLEQASQLSGVPTVPSTADGVGDDDMAARGPS